MELSCGFLVLDGEKRKNFKFNLSDFDKIKQNIFNISLVRWEIKKLKCPEMEFKEIEPRFKSAKTRFKLSAGLNFETFDTILSGTNHILAAA